MQRLSSLLILSMILICSGAAEASPPEWISVAGEYSFTNNVGCVVSTTGFNASFEPIPGGLVWTYTIAVQGAQVLNRDGTAPATGSLLITSSPSLYPPYPPPFAGGASLGTYSLDWTYSVKQDGTVNFVSVPGTFKGAFQSGMNAGKQYTSDNWPSMSGRISADRMTITLATQGEPVVQTVIVEDIPFPYYQICHQSTVMVRTAY
jgi:hypothetical protein